MEPIKLTFTTILLCLAGIFTSEAQVNLELYSSLTLDQKRVLDNHFTNYTVYSADFAFEQLKSKESSKAVDSQMTIELEGHLYTFPLEQNLQLPKNLSDRYICIGGKENNTTYSLTLSSNYLAGQLTHEEKTVNLSPLRKFISSVPSNLIISYTESAIKEDYTDHIGCTHDIEQKIIQEIQNRDNPQSCKIIRYCIANSYDMLTKYGSKEAVRDHNITVLNAVQTNYRSEFDINMEINLVGIYVANSSSEEPFSDNATSFDANTLLGAFRSWASTSFGSNRPNGVNGGFGVDFDYASVWTARDIVQTTSNTIGLAYRPGYLNLLQDYSTSVPRLSILMAHELGHNLGAQHDPDNSGTIMTSSLVVTPDWSEASVQSISAILVAANHLADCFTMGAPAANFIASSSQVCVGSTVIFEDQSQYGATRNWTFENGQPASSSLAKPAVTFNSAGTYTIRLTSINDSGTDITTQRIIVEETADSDCTPSGNSTGGISYFELGNTSSITEFAESVGVYENLICEKIIEVNESTVYEPILEIAGVSDISFFLDMNGNGSFESTENLGDFRIPAEGRYRIPISSPSGMVRNKIIRLRIITSNNAIDDACTAPTAGQIEDYGLFFSSQIASGCTDPSALNYDPNAIEDDGTCIYENLVAWYRDADSDGFGDGSINMVSVDQPTGFVDNDLDCNDDNSNINPLSDEICDNIDNDCNGIADDNLFVSTYYMDADGDGFGNPGVSITSCSIPQGYVTNRLDCNDSEITVFQDALEICDGLDNNCDGIIDNGADSSDGITYFRDADNDGYGNPAESLVSCSPQVGYVLSSDDCNDNNPNVNPASIEICDNIDNNCDGAIDNGAPATTYYRDADNDGYGNPTETIDACEQPIGFASNSDDCDDNNPNINPDSNEICDNLDNNCDGAIDNGAPATTYYRDADNDGYGNPTETIDACEQPIGFASNSDDCDDTNPNINPDANEICDNLDNNCDGAIDNDAPATTYYRDADNDGFGNPTETIDACEQPIGFASNSDDCDDTNPNINPDANEICDNLDNNCDGVINNGAPATTYYRDADNDGFGNPTETIDACEKPIGFASNSDDCDDTNPNINPDSNEICDNLDNNCDGAIDNGAPATTYYRDEDNDGYGNLAETIDSCDQPIGFASNSDDCDDTNPLVYPGNTESCDGIDNNCNGIIDDNVILTTYYQDLDRDGYGNDSEFQMACSTPQGYVIEGGDCNDNNETIHPGAEDFCDGIDNDCDGYFDEDGDFVTFYKDEDGDGYGDNYNSVSLCIKPNGFVEIAGDCNDSNPDINPNSPEVCDGIDNNCDGTIDENTCGVYSGRVWEDNGDFQEDLNEIGLNGIQIRLIGVGKSILNYQAITDEAGNYNIRGVLDGEYILEVDYKNISRNYLFGSNNENFVVNQQNQIARLETIVVEDAFLEIPQIFYLLENTISGNVTWYQDGSPATNYKVGLVSMDEESSTIQETTTDTAGEYIFSGIRPGQYHLEFYCDTIHNFVLQQDMDAETEVVSTYRSDNNNIGQSTIITLSVGQNTTAFNAQLIESSSEVLNIKVRPSLEISEEIEGKSTLFWSTIDDSYDWEYIIQVSKNKTIDYQPLSSCRDCQYFNTFQVDNGLYYYRIMAKHVVSKETRISNTVTQEILNNKNQTIRIYPNPVGDILNLSSNTPILEVSCYDQNGKLVTNRAKQDGAVLNKIDLSLLENGVYMLLIKSATNIQSTKLIINR